MRSQLCNLYCKRFSIRIFVCAKKRDTGCQSSVKRRDYFSLSERDGSKNYMHIENLYPVTSSVLIFVSIMTAHLAGNQSYLIMQHSDLFIKRSSVSLNFLIHYCKVQW
ncbi:hypothetical protein BD560DRAFT_428851 [Blakeslea trispora]|nr:hypothetical protein BD560DRAFT_428851 [Blakeslea trispora]